jgi:hypothetical protein
VGGGILSAVETRAVADPADAKMRLRRSVVKALPSLAAARPQIELSALKAADSRIYAFTNRQGNYTPWWNQFLAGRIPLESYCSRE